MDSLWSIALWRQFGAAIDTLDRALMACPDALWTERIWPNPPPAWFPPQFGEFWYVSFHAVIWLDLYLTGLPEEEFAPPVPFAPGELDAVETLPIEPYTQSVVREYLAATRQKCQGTLLALTNEQARRPVEYGWCRGKPISYLELQMYSMRHVQEHAAQLSLFLGQHGVPHEALDWVAGAKGEASAE